jgi:CheY-like chemotaxis protein
MKPRPITVLVADGDPSSREALQRCFVDAGYRTKSVTCGSDVVLQCELDPPSVLVLNFDLQDMDGYEVCERVRHVPLASDVAIIALTEVRDDMSHAYLAQMVDFAGGDFFFAKPYDRNLLIQLVDDIVRQVIRARNRPQPRFPTRVMWPTRNRRATGGGVCHA